MSEENKIELANCPFCGSSRIEQVSFNLGALVQLECNGCRLKTPRFSSIKSVSNFWNSRADNPRITEIANDCPKNRADAVEKLLDGLGIRKHAKAVAAIVERELGELETENARLKQAEKALLDAISDWYYLHPNPKADEVLSKQYENFLTFGQGGANFSEAQDLAEEAI